jgi:SOS-response transcriptional repressor LexA
MSDTFQIRSVLIYLLNQARISEAELARKINIPRATINRLTSGRTPDPRASTLNSIASYFKVSVDQLMGKQPLISNENNLLINTNSTLIPIIELHNAKNWEKKITKLTTKIHNKWLIINPTLDEGKFAVCINADSMWPQFQVNTLLIISPNKEAKNRDFVIAHLKINDEIVFRQLIVENKNKFLKAINDMFPIIKLSSTDKIIGVITQTRKNYD